MIPTITDSKELAARAADEIERRGWLDGDLLEWGTRNPAECKVCVLGATGAAYFGDPNAGYGCPPGADRMDSAYLNLIDEIGQALVSEYPARRLPAARLFRWNDSTVASQEDPQSYIIGELRRYAESA